MTNLNLDIINNYKKVYDTNEIEQFSKYMAIVNEYIFQLGSSLKIKNENYRLFVINKGLETISHVFKNILLYTKNLDLTFYNTKKALYYYIEFICQIGEENHDFLKLTPKDAILFVYKKTLFSLDENYVKKFKSLNIEKISIDNLNLLIELYNSLFLKYFDEKKFKVHETQNIDSIFKLTLKFAQALISVFKKTPKHIVNDKFKDLFKLTKYIDIDSDLYLEILKKINKYNINFNNIENIILNNVQEKLANKKIINHILIK